MPLTELQRAVLEGKLHRASLRGALPRIAGDPEPLPDALQRLAEDQASQRYGQR